MTQESVTPVNKLRWSKTCLILHLTRWTVRGVAFVTALSSSLSFHVSQSHWSSTFYSLTEYIESQIPPLFYGVSGEIIQGSDITGNR